MCAINPTATAKYMKQRIITNKPTVEKMKSHKILIQKTAEKEEKGNKEIQDKQKTNSQMIDLNKIIQQSY